MAREEEGVIKAKKLSGNGARNFPASRASPPEHYRRPQIARASSGAAWLWKNGGEEHFMEDERERVKFAAPGTGRRLGQHYQTRALAARGPSRTILAHIKRALSFRP
jgi:hypothetical protein